MDDNKNSQQDSQGYYANKGPRTEVGVERDARGWASRSCVVRAGAAVRVVHGVAEPGLTRALASDGEAGGIEGTYELRWA